MSNQRQSPFQRALDEVENFSEQNVAVMPEKPSLEMLRYIAQLTGEDEEKLTRLYAYFISIGRLDGYGANDAMPLSGFAED